ncbi:MAG: DNA photolyase family protein, partial [Planctomycetota bacterium]|nr:DNA photolyase family protein [Planctomycetota bacterium]
MPVISPEAPLSIVWFRRDLRLSDNAALTWAAKRGRVLPVFIWQPQEETGAMGRAWLQRSLRLLGESLSAQGARLLVMEGAAELVLPRLARQFGADMVVWHRLYEPARQNEESRLRVALEKENIAWRDFPGYLLHEPWSLRSRQEMPYRVFTPFWRALSAALDPRRPLAAPARLYGPARWPKGDIGREAAIAPARPLPGDWEVGERAAQSRLSVFCSSALAHYERRRDRPDISGTSRLSPYLHWGEISPRQIWEAVSKTPEARARGIFLRQIGWREFSYYILYHFPQTIASPLRPAFRRFPWRYRPEELRAWQSGETGFPFVDAGMRELLATGWMHNRLRMVVASFLTKDLLGRWQDGAAWFFEKLVDADLANNIMGWQWTSGCGADAAPFFRIFNPCGQAKKFDPLGGYIRKWVPELRRLPTIWLAAPWLAPENGLREAGVKIGGNYPRPLL